MKKLNTGEIMNTVKSTVLLMAIASAGPAAAQLDVPLPGLTAAELAAFNVGKAAFEHEFTASEGLGPLYNRTSCVACHFQGGVGGGEAGLENNVIHFGAIDGTDEERYLDLFERGGPVQQVRSLASVGLDNPNMCMLMPDAIPTDAPGLIQSSRHTPPVFGLGLIDAVPDDQILEYEGRQRWKKPGVLGAANWGVELENVRGFAGYTVIRPRTQPSGAPRVGRFGWHGSTATLFQFSTEPFGIELGITTPFFARENHPQGAGALSPECAQSTPNDPNSAISVELYNFQALLAAPARGPSTRDVRRGERLFKSIGCQDCHRKSFKTAKDYYALWPDGTAHRVNALSNKTFEPWADLLLHDLGPLLDDKRHQGRANGRMWRTTPLWGLRYRTEYLHDGSVTTLEDAIAAHGGEGTWSRDAYFGLNQRNQDRIKAFLDSL